MKLTLVTGGARAGKSDWAEQEASRHGAEVTYVATAEALDEEMALRIEAHRRRRPVTWTTVEEPLDIVGAVKRARSATVVVDCLTLWCANGLRAWGGDPGSVEERVEELLCAASERAGRLIVVTNEVGMGLVPDTSLGRRYRDALGLANAKVAASADRVVLMVSGIPIDVKEGANR